MSGSQSQLEQNSVPEYGCYEIIYTDENAPDVVHIREVMQLVTIEEAMRCAKAWQTMTWTYGRKYSVRLLNLELQTQN